MGAKTVKQGPFSYHLQFTGSRQEKDDSAIEAALNYLGEKKFNILVNAIKNQEVPMRAIHFYAGIAGVQGYPVRAMLRRYHPRYLRRFGGPSDGNH